MGTMEKALKRARGGSAALRRRAVSLDRARRRSLDGAMFAFSLSKLVVLVGIVVAVVYGSKLLARFQEMREAEARRRQKDARMAGGGGAALGDVEETVRCRVCNAYVPQQGATSCGQPGCPYGR